MNELQKVMKDKSPDQELVWSEGMECVALSSRDKRWSRAVIGEKAGDRVKVRADVILVLLYMLHKIQSLQTSY